MTRPVKFDLEGFCKATGALLRHAREVGYEDPAWDLAFQAYKHAISVERGRQHDRVMKHLGHPLEGGRPPTSNRKGEQREENNQD
jgi:hypothetical protein